MLIWCGNAVRYTEVTLTVSAVYAHQLALQTTVSTLSVFLNILIVTKLHPRIVSVILDVFGIMLLDVIWGTLKWSSYRSRDELSSLL